MFEHCFWWIFYLDNVDEGKWICMRVCVYVTHEAYLKISLRLLTLKLLIWKGNGNGCYFLVGGLHRVGGILGIASCRLEEVRMHLVNLVWAIRSILVCCWQVKVGCIVRPGMELWCGLDDEMAAELAFGGCIITILHRIMLVEKKGGEEKETLGRVFLQKPTIHWVGPDLSCSSFFLNCVFVSGHAPTLLYLSVYDYLAETCPRLRRRQTCLAP